LDHAPPVTARSSVIAGNAPGGVPATAAWAATPKPGFHADVESVGGSPFTVLTIQASENGTLSAVTGSTPKCGDPSGYYAGFQITEPLKVRHGEFKFKGKTTNLNTGGAARVQVNLKGRFTTSKHAKGSFRLEGCPGKLKFKTRWGG
jgi:hypothetical protein